VLREADSSLGGLSATRLTSPGEQRALANARGIGLNGGRACRATRSRDRTV